MTVKQPDNLLKYANIRLSQLSDTHEKTSRFTPATHTNP